MIRDYEPDIIIHLAARVGGVKSNTDYVADFFYDNIMINTNVLNEAKKLKIKKVISLLSTCIYPDNAKYPLTPDQIHHGTPHLSNFGYAYAKRMLDVHNRAIRQQYGLKYITAVPNNLYGINDNFDLQNGHVIPAIIRKVWEGKTYDKSVILWGDGNPLREFTYADDISKLLLSLIDYDSETPINIGNTIEISINSVTRMICDILQYDFNIIHWDKSKPKGQHRKPSCNKELRKYLSNFEYTELYDGLKKTCDWFVKEYPNVRGI